MFWSRMKVYHVNKYHSIYCIVLRLLGIRKELFFIGLKIYNSCNTNAIASIVYKNRILWATSNITLVLPQHKYYRHDRLFIYKKKSNFHFLLKIKTLSLFVCSWEKKFTWLRHYFKKSKLVCCIHILFWYVNILNY